MAVPALTPRVVHAGDGTSVSFVYPFPIAQNSDLDVYVGAALQAATAYSVAGAGNVNGGSVTFATPPLAGVTVTIVRDTPVARVTNITEYGDFRAQTFNNEYDRIYTILQDLDDRASRSLVLPVNVQLPASGKRQVSVDYLGATGLTTYDSDAGYGLASQAALTAEEAKSIAEQALAQTRPETGAVLHGYSHTLVAGQSAYQCAPAGLGAPSPMNVSVYYDRVRLLPTIDYALSVNGESIILQHAVVAGVPAPDQMKAGQSLFVLKIAGGLVTPDLTPGSVTTPVLADKAVTGDKEADGTARSVRIFDGAGRPASVAGVGGQFLRFDQSGAPVAGDGPPVATAADVRAGSSNVLMVTPATAAHNAMAPLFKGCWYRRNTNGVMQIAYLQQTIGGAVTMTRTNVGRYTLQHAAIVWQVPLVTFVAPQPDGHVSYKITTNTRTETLIESLAAGTYVDCDVIVEMSGVPQ